MENIIIAGAKNIPKVDFNFQTNIFELSGKCYMEEANVFFKPIMEKFITHLNSLNGVAVVFNFKMIYFNSSSARFVLRIFDQLDETAKQGNEVSIIWNYEEDDDTMEEHGEEFGEDLEHASFELKPIAL